MKALKRATWMLVAAVNRPKSSMRTVSRPVRAPGEALLERRVRENEWLRRVREKKLLS